MSNKAALILAAGLVLAVVASRVPITQNGEELLQLRLDGSQDSYGTVRYDLGTYSQPGGGSRHMINTANGTVLYLNSQWIQIWESENQITLVKTSDVTEIKLSKATAR